MHYIHHYLQLPLLDSDHHKFQVVLFKSDRMAIASLSDSLKQQQVLSEVPSRLLLASTKHRQNIIIQNHHLSPIWNLLQKTGRDNLSRNMGCGELYFIMDFCRNCDRTLTFLVKEFLSEAVILGSTGRQLGRAEEKGVTAYTVQVHRRLKVNRNSDLPELLFHSPCILFPT